MDDLSLVLSSSTNPELKKWYESKEARDYFLKDGKILSFDKLRNEPDYLLADLVFLHFFLVDENARSKTLKPASLHMYERELGEFIEYVHLIPKPLADIGYVELSQYQDLIRNSDKNYSDSTIRRKFSSVKSLLRYGFRTFFFEHDFSNLIKPPAIRKVRQERILSKIEMQSLLDELRKNPLQHLVGVFLYTLGLRVSELCQAKWGDIEMNNFGSIIMRIYGKGDKEEFMKVDPKVFQLLLKFRSDRFLSTEIGTSTDEPLLINRNRNPLSDREVRYMIEHAANRAGLKKRVSPHWIRHTAASAMLAGGATIENVKRMLRHSDIRTTSLYLHEIDTERKKSVLDYVSDIYI